MSRMRNAVITKWTPFDANNISKDLVRFMIWQKEKCPSSGKEHFQIYCEFSEGFDIKKIKKIFNDETMHIEPRKGSQSDAILYCSKEDTRLEGPWKFGRKAQQGHRSDLDSIMDAIEDFRTAREILIEFRGNAIRHISSIGRAMQIYHGVGKDGDLDYAIIRQRGSLRYNPLNDGVKNNTEVEGNTVLPLQDDYRLHIPESEDRTMYRCARCGVINEPCSCDQEPLKKKKK